MKPIIRLAERGWLNDALIRAGIRRLLKNRLSELRERGKDVNEWIAELENGPPAEATDAANEQHYELPPAYFEKVLGPRMKYSCAHWPEGPCTLSAAEDAMLALTCERARLTDGLRILELGCGWGSLTLWMAERFPGCRITALSNSRSQRGHIEAAAAARGLRNVEVVTCDINAFRPEGVFDRVVSVEMFEHVRNHRRLFRRIGDWLAPGGLLFTHVFAHRDTAYLFEVRDARDWMAKHFFTGGMMPTDELLPSAADGLREEARWVVDGRHYARTLEAWLAKHDAARREILEIFKGCYGADAAETWYRRWRMFYMACAELFAYDGGRVWRVVHHLFAKPGGRADA